MKEYGLFTFDSTHYAIRAQKLLAGIEIVVMPVLREISAACGMSIKVESDVAQKALEILERETEGWHLYHILQDGKSITYTLTKERGAGL